MAKGMYAVVGGSTKKVKTAYCVVGGVTKKLKAVYAVVGGTTKLVWNGSFKPVFIAYSDTINSTFPSYYTSEDGTTWTQQTSPYEIYSKSISFGNGCYYAAGPASKAYNEEKFNVLKSIDGINWSVIKTIDAGFYTSSTSSAGRTIYANNKIFVIISQGGTTGNNIIAYSSDESSWTTSILSSSEALNLCCVRYGTVNGNTGLFILYIYNSYWYVGYWTPGSTFTTKYSALGNGTYTPYMRNMSITNDVISLVGHMNPGDAEAYTVFAKASGSSSITYARKATDTRTGPVISTKDFMYAFGYRCYKFNISTAEMTEASMVPYSGSINFNDGAVVNGNFYCCLPQSSSPNTRDIIYSKDNASSWTRIALTGNTPSTIIYGTENGGFYSA